MNVRAIRLALSGLGVSLALAAWANPVTIQRYTGYYTLPGGEFTIHGSVWATQPPYVSTTIVNGGFQSFCLEMNEGVSGQPFWAVVNLSAVMGGLGGGSPDPLSVGTAWLYKQFANGTLASYDYDPLGGRAASAKDLQETIWWLEDEKPDPGSGNAFRNAVLTQFSTEAAAKANFDPDNPANAAFKDVRVLNMYVSTGSGPDLTQPKQDMLVLVPDGGLTFMLLGAGLLGVAALRRKG